MTNNDVNIIAARDYLMSNIGNEFGVWGLMGNIFAESGCKPHNLQNSYEKSLRMTDEQYTQKVDDGSYKNFINDKAGYGICQWTSAGRKKSLLEYKNYRNLSIGDMTLQLEFLMLELQNNYKFILSGLKSATSIQQASDLVLTKFEMPKDQSAAVKKTRESYGTTLSKQYPMDKADEAPEPAKDPTPADEAPEQNKHVQLNYKAGQKYHVLNSKGLNVRNDANGTKVGVLPKGAEVKNNATSRDDKGQIWMNIGTRKWVCADNGFEAYIG